MYLSNMKFLFLLPMFVSFAMANLVYDPVHMKCVEAFGDTFPTYYDEYDDYEYDNNNPLEGDDFEGDMILDWAPAKNGLISTSRKWKGGIIPYVIDKGFTYKQLKQLFKAINIVHSLTCVRFVKKGHRNENYVTITKADGRTCSATIGRRGHHKGLIKLSNRCFERIGSLLHEFMHTMGFYHEQSRSDRDEYVKINCENIIPLHIKNFKGFNSSVITDFGFKYDFYSIMHYSPTAFSKNKNLTIEPLKPAIFQKPRLVYSEIDLLKINTMYNCGKDRSFKDNDNVENVLFIPY